MNNEVNFDKLRSMIARCEWTFAKTMPFAPHEYIVRGKCPLTDEEFLYFIDMQRRFGITEHWGKYNHSYLYIDDYKYWTMGAPYEETIIMNRAKTDILGEVLDLYEKIETTKIEAKKNAPYHFNAVLNAGPLEPGVSKILAGFFWQKTNDEYLILKSFVSRFFGKELSSKIDKPVILAEETVKDDKRIDILVYEKEKYAIVLENKIWDAVDQPNQLANYIEAMMEGDYNFEKEQIYVAFLPKAKDHHPSLNSWVSKDTGESYEEEFRDRYALIDFKEKILSWLEESPEVNEICDGYFPHSRFLFIDFLKRALKIDNIDNMAQTEIEKFLIERYQMSDDDMQGADLLANKLKEIGEVVNQLTALRKDRTEKSMHKWLNDLQNDYKDKKYDYIDFRDQQYPYVGVSIPYKDNPNIINVFIWNNGNYLCLVIGLSVEGKIFRDEIFPLVRDLVQPKGGFRKGKEWLYFKDVTYQQAYGELKDLVSELCTL